jgi:(3,5-dihydroxyphenyl)acetyl-CoA 1,2-dioxygenase
MRSEEHKSSSAFDRRVRRWTDTIRPFVGSIAADRQALTDSCAPGYELLSELPPRSVRSPKDAACAQFVQTRSRELRRQFMELHTEAVYNELTDGRRRHLRVDSLAVDGEAAFPGLLPTPAMLADERRRQQAQKEGWELDQSIFFHSLLSVPTTGRHLVDAMLCPSPRAVQLRADFQARGQLTLETVELTRSDGIAYVTINNQHCLNAEDNALVADLEAAVDLVLLDEHSRVGVLRGGLMDHPRYRGRRVFSAGINLKALKNGEISFVGFMLARELGCLSKILRGLRFDRQPCVEGSSHLSKPWLAAVDTFAIGGGLQLLFVFDAVVSADDAFFSLPAAQEGIIPGAGTLRAPRFLGSRLTRRLILQGERILASSPEATSICDEVVRPDVMDAAIARIAARLDSPAVATNRDILTIVEEPAETFRQYMAEFAKRQAERMFSWDVLARVEEFAIRKG